MKHPLINKVDSSHYDSAEEPSIKKFERKYSITKLMYWAELTLAKYEDAGRASKGQVEADKRKADTYRAYHLFLGNIVEGFPELQSTSALKVYEILNIDLEY